MCILPGRAVPKITYNVSGGTLNPTHSLSVYTVHLILQKNVSRGYQLLNQISWLEHSLNVYCCHFVTIKRHILFTHLVILWRVKGSGHYDQLNTEMVYFAHRLSLITVLLMADVVSNVVDRDWNVTCVWVEKDRVRVETVASASDTQLGSMQVELQRESAKNRGLLM